MFFRKFNHKLKFYEEKQARQGKREIFDEGVHKYVEEKNFEV